MLAGMGEVMHQGVHGNLCGRVRPLNNLMGKFACAINGIDFQTYRVWHFKHHRIVNTPDDPERAVYSNPEYLEKTKGWKELSNWNKVMTLYAVVGIFGNSIVSVLGADAALPRALRWGIPISIAALGFFEGLLFLIPAKVIVVWYLPQFLYSFIDFFLTQSRHYGTEKQISAERIAVSDQYEISWNLKVPRIVGLMLFHRNLHAEHHEYPGRIWITARDKQVGRTLPLGDYLYLWWRNGPRVM
jgi:fatty acid desaturase